MNPPSNRVDKFGLPIPATFNDDRPPRPRKFFLRKGFWRFVLVVAAIGLVGSQVVRSSLWDHLRQHLADNHRAQGQWRIVNGDPEGALAELDRAESWDPGDVRTLELRAQALHLRGLARYVSGDFQGAAADMDEAVKLEPKMVQIRKHRFMVLQRLGRHAEAIVDATKVIELTRSPDPVDLNNRAYARALAKVELKEGLQDIETALALGEPTNAAYLDTRGYLHFLLGRPAEALVDLEQAIQITEEERQELLKAVSNERIRPRTFRNQLQIIKESLAVMYHHRGEAHQALGNAQQAEADLRQGDDFGYNPAAGVL